jgi:hypothetical protein
MPSDLDSSLDELLSDARLVELCELQRTGDEVLDVISLTENQHSDILAWLLDAREGHGQGDEILRDLLIWASTVAAGGESGLDGRGTTARFFKAWPPSRIRTTSFAAAFVARELGMSAAERVDLFVIDAQNKFIALIENKAGAVHLGNQLNTYKEAFEAAVAESPRLRQYDHVYLALDREFDGEDAAERPASSQWMHIGYEWLKTSATRALMHVSRGNAAARLVVSYCNRQTDWEDPNDERCLRLAAELHQAYPEAIKELLTHSRGRVEREWMKNGGQTAAALLFVLQNKSAVAMLKETQGMASVKQALLERVQTLPRANVEHKRAWLDVCPDGWEQFEGDRWWPVFMNVRFSDQNHTKFRLALCWNAAYAKSEEQAEDLRALLVKAYPDFGRFQRSKWRRVVLANDISQTELLRLVYEVNLTLSALLKR